ncbi:hypothetical protein MJO29_011273 [Puccinia striiformis f. sp. tritici]|nr:hypothetical protein MJO29_011273 [Puccinia striiformis f. sp. tritici]
MVSAAKAAVPDPTPTRPPFDNKLYCTVCKIQGHNLLACERAAKILTNHLRRSNGDLSSRSDYSNRDRSSQKSRPGADRGCSSQNSRPTKPPAKAGLTTVVDLGGESDDESDYSGSEYALNATTTPEAEICSQASTDANLDSGCLISMTPHPLSVQHLKSNSTPVHLADHLVVSATQKGLMTLLLSVDRQVNSLVVPGLCEPLLSIAGLCDKSLRVVFTPTSCDIYDASEFKALGTLVGRGYRKGNLFYLPSDEVWYKVPEANRKKLDPKGRASLFLSYLSDGNGYRVWDLQNKTAIKTRDVIFDDSVFLYDHRIVSPAPTVTLELEWPTRPLPIGPTPTVDPAHIPLPPSPKISPSQPDIPPIPPRRISTRTTKPPNRLGNWAKSAEVKESDVDTPKTWKQLQKSPNKVRWLKAANDEFASLLGMSIQKLKARLVAMGYSQVHGQDYDEWKGRQVDFKTAFLNGHLDEPVYMEQPVGFEDSEHPDYVCQVTRSIYGLKQSPRQWNSELHQSLLHLGVQQSRYDPTLYFKLSGKKLVGAITVHVDDLTVVGEDSFVGPIIYALGKRFRIGADEELHHFLSIKITRDIKNSLLYMSQAHYIEELIPCFLGESHTSTPTPTSSYFKDLAKKSPEEHPSPGPYSQLIGSLLWVAQCTRPDISFAVNKLSQFLRDPSENYWSAAL